MIRHVVQGAALAGIAATFLVVIRQVRWERQMLADLKKGGSL